MEIGIIAPVMHTVPPPSYGAIESYVEIVARALATAGHKVSVATTADSPVDAEVVSLLPAAEVRVQGNVSREFLHTRFAYEQLAGKDAIFDFTSVGPLLVHPDGPHVLVYVSAGVTTTPHEQARKSIYEQCGPEITLFTSADANLKTMPEITTPHIVHTGFQPDDCLAPTDATDVLFVGSIRPESRLDEIIVAMQSSQRTLNIIGRIAGDRESNYFAENIKPHLSSSVRYVGEVTGTELHKWWQSTYALVNAEPALESSGLLFLAAQAHGVPVVAPDVAFVHEYTRPNLTSRLFSKIEDLESAINAAATIDRAACAHYVSQNHDLLAFGKALAGLAAHPPSR